MDPPPDNAAIDTVDTLLERYLVLLDEYTSLRTELSRLQAAGFQHLARANFAAERGARFGADSYDERMQATRTVVISTEDGENDEEKEPYAHGNGSTLTFQVVDVVDEVSDSQDAGESATAEEPEKAGGNEEQEEQRRRMRRANDPIRCFGVLAPLALRQTQACAVDVIERVVPRLATVDAAMRALEIEVRRARKRRAKAQSAAAAAAVTDGTRQMGDVTSRLGRTGLGEVPAS